ncbi:MFS transporter [Amycolatopsis regifaucium]|uniref:MFS transporter n=1 Tax=Amycolatopsis regifaucium TaxID=546365 RepID=A0A154MIC8_9PSEU|nr:MFS transporter [Amycolatopsis regifaucium]KZB84122.1 MFS transporter [Amycolatopsis regifaucium]OKA08611.1 MFS transporter [Amycolatopsis regifaucium]SFJ54401.1 Major Facilitator Superfamily protein [Amycolatopsis regifaucium]
MSGRARGVLLVLCGAIFLEGIDVAMLNVALPSIRAELGLSTAMLSGVVSAYVLGYGGFMLLGGRAADLYGRRRTFLTWLVVFLVFSGLGGFATEGWTLLLARFVTGVAAAFMTPAGLSIITTSFEEGPKRDKALLFYAGTAAGGFTLGLVIGGLLTRIDWRWVFFTPVLLSAVILLAALWLIKEPVVRERVPRRADFAGAVTVTAAMLLIAYAVVRLEHPGQGWGWTVASFAGGAAALVAFVAIERRLPAPLVRLGILKSGPLVRANASALLFAGSFFGFQFLVTLYLQELRGWSTLETSLALLAVGVDAVLAPTVTPRLVAKFGHTRVIFAGLVLAAGAYALFLPLGLDWTYAAMFPSMITLGLGFALAYGPLTIVATEGIAEDEQGLAGGLLYTAFQFGAALGLSTVTAVNVAALGDGSREAALGGFRAALVVPLVMAVLAAIITGTGRQRGSTKDARLASDEAIPAS